MAKRTYQNEPHLKNIRQFLRKNGTKAEEILWEYIRGGQLGYKFRRQFSIGNVVVDFYCHTLRLVIELDGWTHNSLRTKEKDFDKQSRLETGGFKIIRLRNEEVFGDADITFNKLQSACRVRAVDLGLTPPLAPPLVGEGKFWCD